MRLRQSLLCTLFLAFTAFHLTGQDTPATILDTLMLEHPQIESWSYQIWHGSRAVDKRWVLVSLGFSLDQDDLTMSEIKTNVFSRFQELGQENVQVSCEYRWTTSILIAKDQKEPWEFKYIEEVMESAYQYTVQTGYEKIDISIDLPDDEEYIRLDLYFSSREKPTET
ncbi:MAG: hypothetical protein KKC64_06990 [Spirochaetes bacterium]|nr:hypothetical protein [Spirochaetota bacterium]